MCRYNLSWEPAVTANCLWFKTVSSTLLEERLVSILKIISVNCLLPHCLLSSICDVASVSPGSSFFFFCTQEAFLWCTVSHLKGFWANVDPCWISNRCSAAECGFISIWWRNQGFVLCACGAKATTLVPGFLCWTPWCRHALYVLSLQKVKLERWEGSTSFEEPTSVVQASTENWFGWWSGQMGKRPSKWDISALDGALKQVWEHWIHVLEN